MSEESYDYIELHKLIIHKVDNATDKPELSDDESPVDDEDIKFFLRRHIVNSEDHRFARSAVFARNDDDDAPSCQSFCDQLLLASDKFVESTQSLAAHLFAIVKQNHSISAGDVVFTTYTNRRSNSLPHLAILKMKPHPGIVTRAEPMANGKTRLVMRREGSVLPIDNLQKCAFILPESARTAKKHLTVLDLQNARRGATQMTAEFFTKSFLQCRTDFSSAELTNAFRAAVQDFRGIKSNEWSEDQSEEFAAAKDAALQTNSISVETFLENTLETIEDKEQFSELMLKKLGTDSYGDLNFKPDQTVQTQEEILVIADEGGTKLNISILASEVGSGKTLEYKKEGDNSISVTIKPGKYKIYTKHGNKR